MERHNIEIKVKLSETEFNELKIRVPQLPATFQGSLQQIDTFYTYSLGSLKLRTIKQKDALLQTQLIAYQRTTLPDGQLDSQITITPIISPETMHHILTAYGVRGQVIKTRLLYLLDQVYVSCIETRIHLDRVENLGYFMEVEIVFNKESNSDIGHQIINQLMQQLCLTTA